MGGTVRGFEKEMITAEETKKECWSCKLARCTEKCFNHHSKSIVARKKLLLEVLSEEGVK